MVIGVLVAAAVAGVIAFVLLLIFRKDVVGVDVSARSLLRLYLYLASLAAVIVFAIGVAAAIDWGMASAFGGEAVYGRPPTAAVCPVGEKCADPDQLRQQYAHEREQRQQRDLLRGITLVLFAGAFWGGHRIARQTLGRDDEKASVLRRAHNVLGTFVFGVGTVILLPVGIYFALAVALVAPADDVYRPGFGDSLAGGLVAVPIWLGYLLRVIRAVPAEKPLASAGRPTPAAVG